MFFGFSAAVSYVHIISHMHSCSSWYLNCSIVHTKKPLVFSTILSHSPSRSSFNILRVRSRRLSDRVPGSLHQPPHAKKHTHIPLNPILSQRLNILTLPPLTTSNYSIKSFHLLSSSTQRALKLPSISTLFVPNSLLCVVFARQHRITRAIRKPQKGQCSLS